MAYFIKEEQFNGIFNLVIEDGSFFQDYADQWEYRWFVKLYGLDLWTRYTSNPEDPDMKTLQDLAGFTLKHFFYFDYVLEVQSFQSTIGSMEADTENAARGKQSRNYKAVKLWNIGVDTYANTYNQLKDSGLYPELPDDFATIEKQNVWGI